MPQHEFITKQLIDKGWSEDRKYCVTDEQGNKFLLRVSPIEQYDRKKSEYELMGQVAALGVPMCRPLEFGTFDEGVYSIQTWIDGIDAEENIHNLTNQEQYSYGFEAGKILKEIHKIPAPKEIEDWEIYFNRKVDHKIKMYEECPVKYENGQAFIDYINAHRYLLSGRPRTYQHGDYHIGNMMIAALGAWQAPLSARSILPNTSATSAHSGLAGSCRGRCPRRAYSAPCQSVQGVS